MASLSQMFPSVTRALSAVRSIFTKSVVSGNEDVAAPESGAQVPLAETVIPNYPILETLPGEQVELDQAHSPASDDPFSILGLYEAWVELEERVRQAQNELQAILATREEAAILRKKAQEVLNEGEAIRAEAQRISEAAWKAFDRGFAVNTKGLPNRWETVREIDQAMKSYSALQRATHQEAWQEADRTRQRATNELLKVLSTLNTAMAQADRELKEATNLPALAASLRLSSEEELRCAQAIRNELVLLGQEALHELDVPQMPQSIGQPSISLARPQDQPSGSYLGAARPGAPPTEVHERGVPPADPALRQGTSAGRRPTDATIGPSSVGWESPQPTTEDAAGLPESPPPFYEAPPQDVPEMAPEELFDTAEMAEALEPVPAAQVLEVVDSLPVADYPLPETAAEVADLDQGAEPIIPPADLPPTAAEPVLQEPVSEPKAASPPQVPGAEPGPAAEPPDSAAASLAQDLERELASMRPGQEAIEIPATPGPTPPLPVPPTLDEEIASARPASELPGSAAASLAEELERGLSGLQPERRRPEAKPDATRAADTGEPTPEPAASAAEELQRELEAMRPLLASTEPAPASVTPVAEEPAPPAIDATPTPPPAPAAPEAPPPRIIDAEPVRPPAAREPVPTVPEAGHPEESAAMDETPAATQSPTSDQAPGDQPPGSEPAPTYTGRLYLMFPSSLSQGRLESVWEVLEQVAGGGAIADTRLISQEAGIQFTLDLGSHEIEVEELRMRLPGARISALEEDRLWVDWPG